MRRLSLLCLWSPQRIICLHPQYGASNETTRMFYLENQNRMCINMTSGKSTIAKMASQQPPQQQAPGGPMPQSGLQQPATLQQQQQQLSQQQDFDPVHRFKMLIPQLKESLQNLMKIASLNLAHNTAIDNGIKSSDCPVQRFDKSLEEFYALCDQLELCLRLAYECLSQSIDSAKHSPNLVPTATKPDTVQTESMSYAQYLVMIKSQISCAKDIHNALLECSKKIAGKGQPQGMM